MLRPVYTVFVERTPGRNFYCVSGVVSYQKDGDEVSRFETEFGNYKQKT